MMVQLKSIGSVLVFIAIHYCSYAQAPIYKGKVIDSSTKEAIPFSTVAYVDGSFGVYADIHGEFEINMGGQQFLVVSCMGYRSDTVKISNDKIDFRTIYLEPIRATLNEVVVKGKKFTKEIRIGFFKKKRIGGVGIKLAFTNSSNVDFGRELVTILKYDSTDNEGLIKSLHLRGRVEVADRKLALRVKLYRGVGDEYSETDLLLNENTFAVNEFSKAGIMTIDLEKFYVILPKGGIRIVIEFIGLLDSEMNRGQGAVSLESAKDLTPTPRSFLRRSKSSDRQWISNGKGLYHNVCCWIQVLV